MSDEEIDDEEEEEEEVAAPHPPPRPVAIPTLQPDPSIRCSCGSQLDNQGMMICCDTCEMWSHAVCYNVSPIAVPDHFFCNHCNPRSASAAAPSAAHAAPSHSPAHQGNGDASRGQKREREEEGGKDEQVVDAASLLTTFGGE